MSNKRNKKRKNTQRRAAAWEVTGRPQTDLRDDPGEAIGRVVTIRGVSLWFDSTRFDDYEVISTLRKADKGDTMAILDLFEYLFTDEERQEIRKGLTVEDGRLPATAVLEFIGDLMKELAPKR